MKILLLSRSSSKLDRARYYSMILVAVVLVDDPRRSKDGFWLAYSIFLTNRAVVFWIVCRLPCCSFQTSLSIGRWELKWMLRNSKNRNWLRLQVLLLWHFVVTDCHGCPNTIWFYCQMSLEDPSKVIGNRWLRFCSGTSFFSEERLE